MDNVQLLMDKSVFTNAAIGIGHEIIQKTIFVDKLGCWQTYSGNGEISVKEDLYGGTAGIVFFLSELYKCTGDEIFLSNAIKGASWLMHSIKENPANVSYSFYSGRSGLIFLFTYLYKLTGDDLYLTQAFALCAAFYQNFGSFRYFDVLNGLSGSIIPLLYLYEISPSELTHNLIECLITILLTNMNVNNKGIFWDKGIHQIKGLCGFSHGASGVGYVLNEAGHFFNNKNLMDLSRHAFLYEDQFYNNALSDWPDFRFSCFTPEDIEKAKDGYLTHGRKFFEEEKIMTAWCHGAPGIGLARLRSFELTKNGNDYKMVSSSCSRVKSVQFFGLNSYTLCHGNLGNATLLYEAADILPNGIELLQITHNNAIHAIKQKKDAGIYRCGFSEVKAEDLSLFNGTAGIGHFFLRLAFKEKTESILLPRMNTTAKAQLNNITEDTIWDNCLSKTFPLTTKVYKSDAIKKPTLHVSVKKALQQQIIKTIQTHVNKNELSIRSVFAYEKNKLKLIEEFHNPAYLYTKQIVYQDYINIILEDPLIDTRLVVLNNDISFVRPPTQKNGNVFRILIKPSATYLSAFNISETTYRILMVFKSPGSITSTYSNLFDQSSKQNNNNFEFYKKEVIQLIKGQILLPNLPNLQNLEK